MNTYNQINDTISAAKTLSMTWADTIILMDENGAKAGCLPLQLVVLTNWITILSDFVSQNFVANGELISDPDYTCLTLDEAMGLVGKINAITC